MAKEKCHKCGKPWKTKLIRKGIQIYHQGHCDKCLKAIREDCKKNNCKCRR